ncbi:Uu.00g019450.m01.CDS01 [Anthostomella pinea]|uniref:Uu.00g019450.m01.CDS01 n=1 Tax=Anthostomella pinea TaxID=933095 RepID=A0AAI8VTG2_9PEZI|nr:Uu.00g019450.m01.CDS01 [Anthostomella pinea]
MPSTPHRILIYAELLSNIRQVSAGCTLHTPSTSGTKATVSPDGLSLTIDHDGLKEGILLPGRVTSPPQLPLPKTGSTSLSWRLPLAGTTNGRIGNASEETVPWSADDLEPASTISCRACSAAIVNAGVLQVWKDLPSENWAEMMEFWHCHKPDHKHGNGDGDEHLATRGYGASSRISAQPGVGFVDLTSFLLSETDVLESAVTPPVSKSMEASNGKPENSTQSTTGAENSIIHCNSCKSQLGVRNGEASSISLFKWQVSINERNPQAATTTKTPSLPQCVSAMLLATMARSGCSKSIILPMKTQSPSVPNGAQAKRSRSLLNIWVFNGNITFSSTQDSSSPVNAVKVLYRMVSQEEAEKMLDSMTSDVQDISLPAEATDLVIELLEKSNGFVPQSDRRFKEWTIGLLEKWNGGAG